MFPKSGGVNYKATGASNTSGTKTIGYIFTYTIDIPQSAPDTQFCVNVFLVNAVDIVHNLLVDDL